MHHPQRYNKSSSLWPLYCQLSLHGIKDDRWGIKQWQIDAIALSAEQVNANQQPLLAYLELHKDERSDYRFNLSSQAPKLFVVLDGLDSEEKANIVSVTVSQSTASQYMDGDYLVLSTPLPLAIQAWIEAYIGRHGEQIEMRRKKRKGAGRASGQ